MTMTLPERDSDVGRRPEPGAATDLARAPAETAIPQLLREQGSNVYRMGLSLCGSPQDAEDLVQETFLLAFRHWHQFQGRSKASTWLYSIAVRACRRRKRLRSGEPQRIESLSELLPGGAPRVPDVASPEEGPMDAQLRREASDEIEHAIAELPRPFRIPLVLKDLAELKVSEVAAILGLKPATVKTRVHRARLQLRKRLVEHLPGRQASPPSHAQQICLDLLTSKQEALDRGAAFPVEGGELCSRCTSLFATLDLGRDLCHDISRQELPPELSRLLLDQFELESQK